MLGWIYIRSSPTLHADTGLKVTSGLKPSPHTPLPDVDLNTTATSTLESSSVDVQWTVTPANVTVPYNSANG